MYKQAIVIRNDLGITKGKIAGQVSHASVSAVEATRKISVETVKSWLNEGQKKIVLKVASENELMEYFELCKRAGIPCELIRDAGHTQLEPNTITCFGAGPWNEEEIDRVLGKLKLL